ncbi:MAG: PDZ domain-containing protein [Planctomycetota bacterium]
MRFPIAGAALALLLGFVGGGIAQIAVDPRPPVERRSFGVRVEDGGIYVQAVDEDSVASAAGLRPGDVILRCGEREVAGFDSVREWLKGAPIGEDLEILVARAGEEGTWEDRQELSLRLAEDRRLGLVIAEGLRVTRVVPDSPAAGAGLAPGDFLTRFGDREAPDHAGLVEAVGEVNRRRTPVVRASWLRAGRDMNGRARFFGRAAPAPRPVPAPPAPPAPPTPGAAPEGLPGPFADLDAVMRAEASLADAIALLEKKQQDPDVASALAKVREAKESLAGLAGHVRELRRLWRDAGGPLRGAMRFMGDLGVKNLDEREFAKRLEEMIREGIDRDRIREALEKEFDVVIDLLETKGEEGGYRIRMREKDADDDASKDEPGKK